MPQPTQCKHDDVSLSVDQIGEVSGLSEDHMKQEEKDILLKKIADLEQQLETAVAKTSRLEKMKRLTDRMVSHDLKSPLSSIASGLYFLEHKKWPSDVQRILRIMKSSTMHMTDMIEHSLDIFRMEEGIYVLPQVRVALNEIIEACVNQLIGLADVLGVTVHVEQSKEVEKAFWPKQIKGDFAKLLCVFSNLLKNALEASQPKDDVRIHIELTDSSYVVTIHNTGVIPESIRSVFFDSSTTCGKHKGTGLGTYSARLIVQAHNGAISFTTEEAKGTDLIVELPFVVQD